MRRITRNGLKPASIANYKQAFDKFRASMGERINLPLDRITPLMLDDFKNHLLSRVSPSTANIALTLVSAAFQAAVDYKIIETNPFTAITKPHKGKAVKRRKFELEELEKVMAACNPEWRSMVKTCLYTGGQRLGDVATLRWSQVDEKRGVIRMTTQKKGKPLMIPIFPALKNTCSNGRKKLLGTSCILNARIFLKARDPDACQISLATSCTSVALLPKTLWLQAKNTKSRKETAQRRGATSMNCPSTASAIRQQPCYMTPVFPLLLCKPLWGTIPGKSMKDTSTLEPRSLHKPLKSFPNCSTTLNSDIMF